MGRRYTTLYIDRIYPELTQAYHHQLTQRITMNTPSNPYPDIFKSAAELLLTTLDRIGCCHAIGFNTSEGKQRRIALTMFKEYFKPEDVYVGDYWFGNPKGEFTGERQRARCYALLLMSEISKEYTPESP